LFLAEMGRLLCLGVPAGTSVGLDMHAWTVGATFGGFGGVSAGTHLLHVAANPNAPRASVFFCQPPGLGSVVVARWDAAEEQLVMVMESPDGGRTAARGALPDDEDAIRRAGAAVTGAFDSQLGPADRDHDAEWASATCFVAPDVYGRFQPVRGVVQAAVARSEAGGEGGSDSAVAATRADDSMGMVTVQALFFLPVRGVGTSAAPGDVTAHALDTTGALHHALHVLVRRHGVAPGPQLAAHVLGELQAAFLLAWLGESLPGLEQWKRLVDVLMRAEDAMAATTLWMHHNAAAVAAAPADRGTASAAATDPDVPAILPLPAAPLPLGGGVAASPSSQLPAAWVATPGFWSAAYGAIALQLDRLPEEALQWGDVEEDVAAAGMADSPAADGGDADGAAGAGAAAGMDAGAAPLRAAPRRPHRSNRTFLERSFRGLAGILARSDGGVIPGAHAGALHPALCDVGRALLLHAGSRFVPEWVAGEGGASAGDTTAHAMGAAAAAAAAAAAVAAPPVAAASRVWGGAGAGASGEDAGAADDAATADAGTQAERAALLARLLLEGGDDDLPAIVE
jgi:hypothetical protein